MQTPAFSARSQRLGTLTETLRTRVHVAQLRLANAERGLRDAFGSNTCAPCSTHAVEAYRAERDLARQELCELRERQSRCLAARDRHTGELPNGSFLIVLDGRTGEEHVIERRDGDNPPEFGIWYRLGSDDPMTFDTAIGVDEGYSGHEFFRLYTAEQVDDLLDRAGLIPSTMWDLTATSPGKLTRAETVLSMIPDRKETRYLHDYLANAKAEESRYQWHHKSLSNVGIPEHQNSARLDSAIINRAVSALAVALKSWGGPGLPMVVKYYDGRLFPLNSLEVEFNTTLAAGCDQLRLATKLYGWAETHAWIADADRNWVADLIQQGLDRVIYRAGLWSQHGSGGKVWIESGWGGIQDLLRTTRGPVVLYTSAAEDFPSPDMDSFMIPWPEGVPRRFDALSEEQRAERRKRHNEWNDLTPEQQWEYGVRELTKNLSSVQISPATLRSNTFGPGVTLFDLFAEDRIERVESHFADFEGRFGPWDG